MLQGSTGVGKSTAVPYFCIDSHGHPPSANVLVTQPRRVAATGLAFRVADMAKQEMGTTVPPHTSKFIQFHQIEFIQFFL